MPLPKLPLPPDDSSYAATPGNEVLRVQLAGGKGRYRRDMIGATATVNVTWVLGPSNYEYLRAFARSSLKHGSLPFLIDLILDSSDLTEHTAYFLPGTFQLTGQQGLTYWCSAQLEVIPIPDDAPVGLPDNLIVYLYDTMGENWKAALPGFEASLDSLTNEVLPVDLPNA